MNNKYLSTFSFIKENKAICALFSLMMSFIICVQLIAWGWVNDNSVDRNAANESWKDSCYQISFDTPITKGEFESLYAKLSFLGSNVLDLAIMSGHLMEYGDVANADGSSGTPILMLSYYPQCSSSRMNESLALLSSDDSMGIMRDFHIQQLRLFNLIQENGDHYEYSSDRNTIYIFSGDYDMSLEAYGVPILTLSYDSYMSIVDFASIISIQCNTKLSSQEIERIKVVISAYPNAVFSCYADMEENVDTGSNEWANIYLFVTIVALICICNAIVLMFYVLSMRRREFDVYRMTGATELDIFKVSLSHFIMLTLLSNGLGLIFYYFAHLGLHRISVSIGSSIAMQMEVILITDILAMTVFTIWFVSSVVVRFRKSIMEQMNK